jgi:hypothetical protein
MVSRPLFTQLRKHNEGRKDIPNPGGMSPEIPVSVK